MKAKIILAIQSEIDYLKTKEYWNDIFSFCLYTDEDASSLSLLFNTRDFYESNVDLEYPLTYKYLPSEWFSETIRSSSDEKIYLNYFFKDIEPLLREKPSNFYYKDFLDAMSYCVKNEILPNKNDFIYLVMRSDAYNGNDIINDNHQFNSIEINNELKTFIKKEL